MQTAKEMALLAAWRSAIKDGRIKLPSKWLQPEFWKGRLKFDGAPSALGDQGRTSVERDVVLPKATTKLRVPKGLTFTDRDRAKLLELIRSAKPRYELRSDAPASKTLMRYGGHDVSNEPRDEKGRWTTVGGSRSAPRVDDREETAGNPEASRKTENDNSPNPDEWSLSKKENLWRLAPLRLKAIGRLITANNELKAYNDSWITWDPYRSKSRRLHDAVNKANAEFDAINSEYIKTLGIDPGNPLLVAGDEALQWSYGYKFYKTLEYAYKHNLFDKKIHDQIGELQDTLKDPEALTRFILMMGGMMVAKKALCKAGLTPVAGGLLTAKEAAEASLTLWEIKSNLDAVTYASEVSNAAPKVVDVMTDLLKQLAFAELLKRIKCFAAGTQVVVAESPQHGGLVRYQTVAIETLKPGDLVLARDELGSAVGLQRIEETFQRTSDHLRVLKFADSAGTTQTIRTTDEHPFWIVEQNQFVRASELSVGVTVAGPQGECQKLVATSREEHLFGMRVYNFRVLTYRTYFVSATADNLPLLVHNANDAYGGKGPKRLPTSIDPAATRPKLRKATKQRAKTAASKTAEGDFIDPYERVIIPKEGPFDYGHLPGQEWWRTRNMARAKKLTRKQVIEIENAKLFQIEHPPSNRGHKHEKPK